MKIFVIGCLALSLGFVATAQEQLLAPPPLPVAGVNRPAVVPEGYLITPYGYFHPSCVKELATGDTVQPDGTTLHPDGTRTLAAACAFKSFMVTPRKRDPQINGWVEDIDATTGTAYGKLTSTWVVPAAPKSSDGQTIYFFPGFQTLTPNPIISIVQPVLGWYTGSWTIASWNCCISGIVYHSPQLVVQPGHNLAGQITSNCAAGKTYCATWNVITQDVTTNTSTTLATTPADGQVWNWTFGAVLEAYGVMRCTDYPATTSLTFNTTVYDDNFKLITKPGWGDQLDTNSLPRCNYNQTIVTNTLLKLSY